MTIAPLLIFGGLVTGLTLFLARHSKRDADRWLVDRRHGERREGPNFGPPAGEPERRHVERRRNRSPRIRKAG